MSEKSTRYAPGRSGNPAGRPKGSRNKLGEAFIADLFADWTAHGASTIATVREQRPHEYLKVVASLLPRDINLRDGDGLSELSDERLAAVLRLLESEIDKEAPALN